MGDHSHSCAYGVLTPQHSRGEDDNSADADLDVLRRRREESSSERDDELKQWLESLDDGQGILIQYFDTLRVEFDSDLTQIAAVKKNNYDMKKGILGVVDPIFWEAV